MSPEVRNASPRLTSAAISVAEEWRSAGGSAMPVAGLCTTVELTCDDVIADADLVSAFGAACTGSEFATQSSGGWSIDPSLLIGLLFPVLLEERRSAEGSNTTVAGRSVAVGLTGGGDMVTGADPVSAFRAGRTGSEFLPPTL